MNQQQDQQIHSHDSVVFWKAHFGTKYISLTLTLHLARSLTWV